MLRVFAWLSFAALASLLFGTGWMFSLSARYTLAGQLVLLGASLDALRAFYHRALDLLDPATALSLVSAECSRYIRVNRDGLEQLVRIQRATAGDKSNIEALRYTFYNTSHLPKALNFWTSQLEEFAHKGIARRDTQGVNAVIRTMADIGRNYAEARRNSMLLRPDFTGGIPIGMSDIGDVLQPVYESIKSLCEDAAKQPSEAVVRGCLSTLGDMAAHAMTMVHDADGHKTVPLVFSPLFYLDLCVKPAIAAWMEDALLTAITATEKLYSQISRDIDTQSAEQQPLDTLFIIALASYAKRAIVSCFKSVEMMLHAAQRDIHVRGYRDVGSVLSKVLSSIVTLMPLEAAMDTSGQRIMQIFPPYSRIFAANLPRLLSEVARRVKPMENGRWRADPFHEFSEASEAIVHHYRDVAEKVNFGGGLLEKWVIDSLIDAAQVHIHLLDNPPNGTEPFLDTVDKRLQWFLHAPAFYFREQTEFPYHHASEACESLAVLGIALLKRQRLQSAKACGDAIGSIAANSANAKAETSRSYTSHYGFADCVVTLELLARAADALDLPAMAAGFRANDTRPEGIADEEWPEYSNAVANRTRHMERNLREWDRGYDLRPDAIGALRELLTETGVPQT
jgi:hypothetical protein